MNHRSLFTLAALTTTLAGCPLPGWPPSTDRGLGTRADFDGDGYEDLVVGAEEGSRVLVFNGSPAGLGATPDLVIEGPEWSYFGGSLGTGGDVNCDGFDDLVVGANAASFDDVQAGGGIFVYAGSADGLPATPTYTIGSTALGPDILAVGFSFAPLGDVNDDDCDDIVVGAPGSNGTFGTAHVLLGSTDGPSVATAVALSGSNELGGNFGVSVDGVDIDGDGTDEVVVGETYFWIDPVIAHGRVWIYEPDGTLVTTLSCPDGDFLGFGRSISRGGDLDGDGAEELFVGAYGVGGNTGAVYAYRGAREGAISTTPVWTITPPEGSAGGFFGWRVAGGGDIDGDGRYDLAIGETDALELRGRVHLYFSPRTGTDARILVHEGPGEGIEFFGGALATRHSYDRDRAHELVVAASETAEYRGAVYLFDGESTVPTWTAMGEAFWALGQGLPR